MTKRTLVGGPDAPKDQTASYVDVVKGGRTLVGAPAARPVKLQDRPRPDPVAVETAINTDVCKKDVLNKGDFHKGVLSTGSTLLDLAISGNRIKGGGVPAGIIMEIYGPSSSGKTAVLADLGASCKYKGGAVKYNDPEARLDTAYARRCGLDLCTGEYAKPNTVQDLKKSIFGWKPKPIIPGAVCVQCSDSIAAFSTEAEMDDGHKMAAAKRAAEFHQLFRTLGRQINDNGWIIACSNQEQVDFNSGAKTTPGGNAIKYWASVRIRIAMAYPNGKISKSWTITNDISVVGVDHTGGKSTISKEVGIRSIARVVKNSCDDPFAEVPIFIMFGQGVDDVQGNLIWVKETLARDYFDCINAQYKTIWPAIRYIEEHNLEAQLRDQVIDLWYKIQRHFHTDRKPKVRF